MALGHDMATLHNEIKTWNRQDEPPASRKDKKRNTDRKYQEGEGQKEMKRKSITLYKEHVSLKY